MKKTYIIAEAGVNHNGSLELAKKLVDVAKKAGADAVKFQTFNASNLVSEKAPKAVYQLRVTSETESQYQMLKRLELSSDDHLELQAYSEELGIQFLSTPFDSRSVDFLHRTMNLPMIKLSSGDITNMPLLLRAARTGKRIILSTGMSTIGEIETALCILSLGYLTPDIISYPTIHQCEQAYFSERGQAVLQEKVSILHCTTEYPAPFEEVNLRVMNTLREAFDLPVGYSDHTPGIAVSIAAVACGAEIIEKHFTLDKTLPGPDHQASLSPEELNALVEGIRQVELALGRSKKLPSYSEYKNRADARRSLVALQKIQRGDVLSEENMGTKRPGNGISPVHFEMLQHKRAERDYEKDDLIGV